MDGYTIFYVPLSKKGNILEFEYPELKQALSRLGKIVIPDESKSIAQMLSGADFGVIASRAPQNTLLKLLLNQQAFPVDTSLLYLVKDDRYAEPTIEFQNPRAACGYYSEKEQAPFLIDLFVKHFNNTRLRETSPRLRHLHD